MGYETDSAGFQMFQLVSINRKTSAAISVISWVVLTGILVSGQVYAEPSNAQHVEILVDQKKYVPCLSLGEHAIVQRVDLIKDGESSGLRQFVELLTLIPAESKSVTTIYSDDERYGGEQFCVSPENWLYDLKIYIHIILWGVAGFVCGSGILYASHKPKR